MSHDNSSKLGIRINPPSLKPIFQDLPTTEKRIWESQFLLRNRKIFNRINRIHKINYFRMRSPEPLPKTVDMI